VSPVLERADDSEHFLVIDLVIALSVSHRLRSKGDWVPEVVVKLLKEDSTGSKA
jgi:hypothetical protein